MSLPESLVEFYSDLQLARLKYHPPVPSVLEGQFEATEVGGATTCAGDHETIAKLFPNLFGSPRVDFRWSNTREEVEMSAPAYRVGVVLSGGQAAGGHNVIVGLYDFLKKRNPESAVFGFLNGPAGIFNGKYAELTASTIDAYRNQGGFDMIGSGRHKIETDEQFSSSLRVCTELGLNGLVVIGGDDSNTNACVLAEYFRANNSSTVVVGVPKTIDGDLKNHFVETSFGFDSATKSYAELIGNVMVDALSSRNAWHWIRLMGRNASHITVECALQAHPNVTLVGEEVAARQLSLEQLTHEICDAVVERSQKGKHYGVIVLPEGIIDFIPEVSALIAELNDVLSTGVDPDNVSTELSDHSRHVFDFLPAKIQRQLLLDRDPHGNVALSLIETEVLLYSLVDEELERRRSDGKYDGPRMRPQFYFFGYEGRAGLPSNFDCDYCNALGHTAGALIACGRSGYMATVRHLDLPPSQWVPCGTPITMLMNMEKRKGKMKPVIRKALTDLEGTPFQTLKKHRAEWLSNDMYRIVGPIQFSGSRSGAINHTLAMEIKDNNEKSAA